MAIHIGLVVFWSVLLIAMQTLHGICLSFPYYAEASDLGHTLSNLSDLASYQAYHPDVDANYGFWKMCFNVHSNGRCYNFGLDDDAKSKTVKAPDWVIACQAISIIGLVFGAVGVALPLIWLHVHTTNLLAAGSMLDIAGGIAIIIADIVFATKKSVSFVILNNQLTPIFGTPADKYLVALDDSFEYDWNFGLDIATGIGCVLIGCLFAISAFLTHSDRLYINKHVV